MLMLGMVGINFMPCCSSLKGSVFYLGFCGSDIWFLKTAFFGVNLFVALNDCSSIMRFVGNIKTEYWCFVQLKSPALEW